MTSRSALEALSRLSGVAVRAGGPGDAVQGVVPGVVVEPEDVSQTRAAMAAASRAGLSVVPRGGGSKLDWSDPPRSADVLLDTRRLRGVVDHASGDLVVVASAGTRLADLRKLLEPERQCLAIDARDERATLGGIVATNAAGPRQLLYGRPRDLLVGIAVVLADGTVARSGGRVVKNVAGYDLAKLYAGSLGTLGVIVETTFRLHPIPEATETRAYVPESTLQASRAAQEVNDAQLEPSFLTLQCGTSGRLRMRVGLSGSAAGVRERAEALQDRLTLLDGVRKASPRGELGVAGDSVLRVGFRPSDLPRVLGEVRERAGEAGASVSVECETLMGVADVHLAAPSAAVERIVTGLRASLGSDATVLLRRGAPEVKRNVGSFGRLGAPASLLGRVKRELDPAGVLSPGRVPWA